MDYLQSLVKQAKIRLSIILLLNNLTLVGGWWLGSKVLNLRTPALVLLLLVLSAAEATLIASKVSSYLMQPIKAVWQAVLHISPDTDAVAPRPDSLKFGRELVASLTARVYRLAIVAEKTEEENRARAADLHSNFIAQNLPLPLIVLDPKQNISFANEAAADYIGLPSEDMHGKNAYMVLDMSFPSED